MQANKQPILWKIFPAFLLVIVLALGSHFIHSTETMRRFHTEQTRENLRRLAVVAERDVAHISALDANADLNRVCVDLGKKLGIRLTVMAPNGKILGDSDEDPALMENHSGRPEMMAALQGRIGEATRYSQTIEEETMYVAVPLMGDTGISGAMRTSLRLSKLSSELRARRRGTLAWVIAVALATATVSFYISRRVALPLERMRLGAERFAQGDFSMRITESSSKELYELAHSMNSMAEQLSSVIENITRQRNELHSILTSMIEGVIAIDLDHGILTINQAARDLLGIEREDVNGRPLEEVVRNSELRNLVLTGLAAGEPIHGEIIHHVEDEERTIHVNGNVLEDSSATCIGIVVVLHDHTRLRALEQIRRDFVANVSHELRTPITSIQGFAETLLDGAIDNPNDAKRFLAIIDHHTKRLTAIIDDLLTLSQVERVKRIDSFDGDSDPSELEAETLDLAGVLASACQMCMTAADEKGIAVQVDCPDDLAVAINPRLFEQALTNLIDNAINYSNCGTSVEITAARLVDDVCISVKDHGIGIPKGHLGRIFERFYRVDKARSRDAGGTGLGLAITKHITQAHGGRIDVESQVNKGTTFTIRLPLS